MIRMPAEWEPQDAVLLTWPHPNTDWRRLLARATANYFALLDELLNWVTVIVAVQPEIIAALRAELAPRVAGKPHRVHLFAVPCNDTWARDHGPIAVERDSTVSLQDFTFNGWGNKYAAELDNRVSAALAGQGVFGENEMAAIAMVLEGGAIESDGAGHILTTRQCLLNPNRNPQMRQADIERALADTLGAHKVLWLGHGYLAGDDTDSHVDTLARLAPNNTIVYLSCDDSSDEHYAELKAMEAELRQLRTIDGAPFTLIPLPWPQAKYDTDGERLPATYANYLVTNGAVLAPVYQDPSDALALAQLRRAFPERRVVPLNCLALIEQHGSLHCATMQFPQGSINPELKR